MRERSAIVSRLGNDTNRIGCVYPFLRRKVEAMSGCRILKGLEFVPFEIGVCNVSYSPR